MKHLFKATKMGWDRECEGIWFDASKYSREEAIEQFRPVQDYTQDGYPYTKYEYEGQIYYDFQYLGEFEDDKLPNNDREYMDVLLKRKERED